MAEAGASSLNNCRPGVGGEAWERWQQCWARKGSALPTPCCLHKAPTALSAPLCPCHVLCPSAMVGFDQKQVFPRDLTWERGKIQALAGTSVLGTKVSPSHCQQRLEAAPPHRSAAQRDTQASPTRVLQLYLHETIHVESL